MKSLGILGNPRESLGIIGNHWKPLGTIGNHWKSLLLAVSNEIHIHSCFYKLKFGANFLKILHFLQHNHPYLSAMINNGSVHYDHDRDGTHTMIGGCEVKFRNFAHDTYMNIRYENDVLTGKN